ncbi:uncharacterized protein PAC_01284 [Phialocephala subalpina]|uniref:Fungal N-terminal domain-containing protein n=1 Tax=Phialocephala subalpina TaxID=576137 RepID=A0A1L7WF95_9HELO|nr:uncharacterized protein PAC_01284 [Phialocephala subalpina]
MSFGWSAGDIVAALKLLYQISSAVRDSGGASSDFQDILSFLQTLSQTLQHLNALQATYLDPAFADHLRQQCNHIRVPLTNFLDDVGRKFGPALGTNSRRKRVFAVPRMIQWTVSDSKKTKRLQDRIAVPMSAVGLILGQQIIHTTLAMPENIQDRISHLMDTAVDTRIIPATTHINNNIAALSVGQSSSADTITRNLHEIGRTTAEAIHTNALEGREATARMEGHLKRILISQEASAETSLGANTGFHAKLEDVSITQATSTDLVVRCTKQAGEATADAIRRHALETRAQSSSLHRKLVEVGTSMDAIQDALQTLSASRLGLDSDLPKTEVERAIQDIFGSICLLLSSLQNLIRELV